MENEVAEHEKKLWEKLLQPRRWGREFNPIDLNKERSEFAKDYDRIIFSSAFRALGKKTQVHPLSHNDRIHNRLNHSLEASCVGRSLGDKLGIFLKNKGLLPDFLEPYDIGEIARAACLAHDIGNPPFGHAGEDAVRDWFSSPENNIYLERKLSEWELADFRAFDGNAQGFRIINALEMYKNDGGMRLTYPTIASFVKYPFCSLDGFKNNTNKFNFYSSEKDIFDKIFSALGLKINDNFIRHPISYLTEASDDICYRIIDMEDALELEIITKHEMEAVIEPIKHDIGIKDNNGILPDLKNYEVSYIRAKLINFLSNKIFETFIDNYNNILNGEANPLCTICEKNVKEYFKNAKDIFYEQIIKAQQKTILEIGSYSVYKRLLDNFIPAAHDVVLKLKLSYKQTRALDLMGINAPTQEDKFYPAYLKVVDFVSGMTDNYATIISRQLAGV